MNIIKKLIIRNELKKELSSIDDCLANEGYYMLESRLMKLVYQPDEYAELCKTIEDKFRVSLNKKNKLEKDIKNLSGKYLFTNAYELEK